MADEIKYRSNGNNAVLKLALYNAYRGQCYLCGKPQGDFEEVEIDHIVARTAKPEEIRRWVSEEHVEGYDVNAPYNLAPICRPCNSKKSNRDLSGYGIMAVYLDIARKKQDNVIKKARFYQGPSAMAKFLRTFAEMDFDDSDVASTFEEHMPPLVRRLASIDVTKAQDFDELRTIRLATEPGESVPNKVSLTLDAAGRKSISVFEDVCGLALSEALQLPIKDLHYEVLRNCDSSLESHQFSDRNEVPDVDDVDGDTDANIDEVTFDRDGTYFAFVFSGRFIVSATGSIAVASADGDTTEYLSGYVYGDGRFAVTAGWNLDDDECVEAFVEILQWRAETDIA